MTQKEHQPDPAAMDYHATSFSAGRMDFAWEEYSAAEIQKTYADWEAGKGLIGGDPFRRPGSDRLPEWGLNHSFFRSLAMDDPRGNNGARLGSELASTRPVEIEIGFGRGDFLLDRATRHPETIFLGYETKTKAARLCLSRLDKLKLQNLWISDDDCRFNMPRLLPTQRVSMIHILFPDPWWKAQHQVKRLFSPPFVDMLATILQPGGLLHFKSDVEEYGEMVRYLVDRQGNFLGDDPSLAEQIGEFSPTHREFWCRTHQRPVYSYFYQRR